MGLCECKNGGGSTNASFGCKDNARAEFCVKHKKTIGMAGGIGKTYAYLGCSSRSSYGTAGSRKAMFCSERKQARMVNVTNRRCAYCFLRQSYCKKGRRGPKFCINHTQADMVCPQWMLRAFILWHEGQQNLRILHKTQNAWNAGRPLYALCVPWMFRACIV